MERIINKLLDLRLFRSFKVKTTPRWIILLLDMLIVMVSYVSTVVTDIYSLHQVPTPMSILVNGFIIFAVYPDRESATKTWRGVSTTIRSRHRPM